MIKYLLLLILISCASNKNDKTKYNEIYDVSVNKCIAEFNLDNNQNDFEKCIGEIRSTRK